RRRRPAGHGVRAESGHRRPGRRRGAWALGPPSVLRSRGRRIGPSRPAGPRPSTGPAEVGPPAHHIPAPTRDGAGPNPALIARRSRVNLVIYASPTVLISVLAQRSHRSCARVLLRGSCAALTRTGAGSESSRGLSSFW